MAILDEDHDVWTIATAVILGVLGVGALLYAYNQDDAVQTALNFPIVEKTVPTIVPAGPQM
jgi:hypothetical protein